MSQVHLASCAAPFPLDALVWTTSWARVQGLLGEMERDGRITAEMRSPATGSTTCSCRPRSIRGQFGAKAAEALSPSQALARLRRDAENRVKSVHFLTRGHSLPGRILWAWVGGFFVAPHLVLGGLAFGMAVSIGLIGAFTPHWPLLAIGAVTMVVSATALSWHGIMLSEAARLAPPGRVGAVTGGVLSFGQIGALSSPAVFSLLLGLSGGYSAGWVVCAVPAVVVGVNMFRQGKPVQQRNAL
jgi:hypothetical protein